MEFKKPEPLIALSKMWASKEWKVGDTKYFVYLETLENFGKNEATLHIFHPAKIERKKFVFDATTKVGMWGCKVLDKNIADVAKPNYAVQITLEPTPQGKKYYNFQVALGDQVIDAPTLQIVKK